MDLKTVMSELESCGTDQNRKVYVRHGIGGDMFGVSYANLEKMRKKIKLDQELANELWATGNHDAQILATMISDPKLLTDKQAEDWVKRLKNYVLTEMFTRFLSKSPLMQKKAEKWIKSKDEWIATAGWGLLGLLALNDQSLPDDYFEKRLQIIETDIHKSKNRVRHEMNGALIAIGVRSERLEKRALAVAKKIGKVEVDHGETNCKTPDATEYIIKTKAYRNKKKAAKAK